MPKICARKIFIISICLSSFIANAQNAPGGVGNRSTNWEMSAQADNVVKARVFLTQKKI